MAYVNRKEEYEIKAREAAKEKIQENARAEQTAKVEARYNKKQEQIKEDLRRKK